MIWTGVGTETWFDEDQSNFIYNHREGLACSIVVILFGTALCPAADNDFTYTEYSDNAQRMLYDRKKDPSENENVADKNPEKVEELLAKWEKWAVRAKVQPWPYKTK